MKILTLILISLTLCISCKKEKFTTPGDYLATVKVYIIDGGDTIMKKRISVAVKLINETDKTVEYLKNENSNTHNILDKSNRNLSGIITHHHLGIWDTDSAHVTMERELFGKNISGTLKAKSFHFAQWWDSEGTIFLEYVEE